MSHDWRACLPNFFILGAAKAGTTTLFDLLKQHPGVYLPFNKEPMFFCTEKNYRQGLEWYARTYFRQAAGRPARGEASPHYLYWGEKVAGRMKAAFGQAPLRFVVILRDPVARAYSWYWNMVKEGREDLDFPQAIEKEDQRLGAEQEALAQAGSMRYGYLRGSRYAALLQPFLAAFRREDFLFLLQDDLGADFQAAVGRLLAHLGLDAQVTLAPVLSNPATRARSQALQGFLRRESGWREKLKKVIPIRLRYGLKRQLLQANSRPAHYQRLAPALERELRERLAPDVRRLETIIERDLSAWLPN